jgi:DNA-binding MarR family transcriptional regulator
VRDGLAVRETDPDDARAVRVRPTPTGARTLKRGRARRVRTLETSLSALSPTELAALGEGVEVLERILRDG